MPTPIPANFLFTQLQQAQEQHLANYLPTHPGYLAKQKAWQHFQELGLPDQKNENYRYTPITPKLADHFIANQPSIPHTPHFAAIQPFLSTLDTYQIILFNGRLLNNTLATLPLRLGEVSNFTDAYNKQHPYFLQYGYQYDPSSLDAFSALNISLFEEGTFIHIADHVVLDKPLWVYHITDSTNNRNLTYPHTLITLGKNSEAHIISSWHTLGEQPSFTNTFNQIHVADNARLNYYSLQTQNLQQAYHIHALHSFQAANSYVNHYSFTWDGLFIRNNPYFTMHSSPSETNVYGLYCLTGQQHIDNHTTIDHKQPHTQSNEIYKGIIANQATAVFNGRIYVHPAAQKTQAFQANNNLLISDQATIHTKPQLEIWADDVKCSHGATVGQLNPDELFYLQARGIPAYIARHLLLEAFASEVIDKVPLADLKHYLYTSLSTRFKTLGSTGHS
jgi:Fe-S cluster assembly protein SufD